MDIAKKGLNALRDPQYSRYVAPALLLFDAVLCGLVVWKVPCKFLFLQLIGFCVISGRFGQQSVRFSLPLVE